MQIMNVTKVYLSLNFSFSACYCTPIKGVFYFVHVHGFYNVLLPLLNVIKSLSLANKNISIILNNILFCRPFVTSECTSLYPHIIIIN